MNGLLQISKFLGFNIPYNMKKGKTIDCGTHCYYSYLIIVLIIGSYIYSTIKIYDNVMPTMTTLQIFTECSVYLCIIILDITTILGSILKQKSLRKYLILFVKIDKSLTSNFKVRNYQNTIKLQIFGSHFLYVLLECLNIYSWIYKFGIVYYKNYIFEVFIKYYIVIITMIICNFTLSIRRRFQYLNDKLKQAIDHDNLMNVNEIKKLFHNLNALVKFHNDLFGYQIFMILNICVLSLLDLLSYVLDIRYTFVEIILDVTYFIDSILLVVRTNNRQTNFFFNAQEKKCKNISSSFRYKR